MIDPVTGFFEVTRYSDKKAMMITNVLETMWLVWYPWTVDIMYNQEGEFLSKTFKIPL